MIVFKYMVGRNYQAMYIISRFTYKNVINMKIKDDVYGRHGAADVVIVDMVVA